MLKILENELNNIKQIEEEIIKTIKEAPEGNFRCSKNRSYYQYYQGEKYLDKSKRDYVKKIAQRDYCLKIKDKVLEISHSIKQLIKLYEEMKQVYHELTPGRKILVKPLITPIENIIREFESIEYQGKEFNEEDTREYYTSKGERVRSKSEKIIADELCRHGIPYKYELPIDFVDSRGRKFKVYPDFTALNKRNGDKWIIEHFGLMDYPDYYDNAMLKLDTYERNGYLLGKNLLIFHETDRMPLNIKVMQKYIEHYLL